MAKQSENVLSFETELNKGFNPVKTENKLPATVMLVDPTGQYIGNIEYTPDGGMKFNGHKVESEQPKIKPTAAFDNSRLEFLRMQIAPVQSFYQTLGNILFSLSMRLDVAEAKVENLKEFYDQLTLERVLYKRYAEYCKENNLQWSEPGFVEFIREYAKEEEDETRIEN